jgi:hypothetical protein
MLKKVYDGSGMSGGEGTKGLQTDDMLTCTTSFQGICS